MNALILVETRRVDVNDSLDRHLKFLPADWIPIVVCSKENQDTIGVKKILIPYIKNYYYEYNHMFARPDFWDRFIQYDRVIVCHQDSGLLREGIDEFMEWDYVGAPWKFQHHGGNGGLSLRNPKIMREIAARFIYSMQEYEDVYFCNRMFDYKIGKLAPRDVCKRFSCETIFELGTLGYHGIVNYEKDQPYTVDEILMQYNSNK